MKIGIAQLNYIIGDFKGNTELIIENIKKAERDNLDLIIFSELAVSGYPPQDLLEQRRFIEESEKSVKTIAQSCTKVAAIVGSPRLNTNSKGKLLYNSAFFCRQGKVDKIIDKTLLPTYDIFDEYRYFEPNTLFSVVEFMHQKIAITICEDLWYEQPVFSDFGKNKLYTVSPMKKLSEHLPNLVINIAASPFSIENENIKKSIFTSNAKKYNVPIVYVNQIGAHTELIFDGGSMLVNKKGEVIKELSSFKEDYLVFDINELESTNITEKKEPDMISKIHDALILGIRDYFKKMNFKTATLGLSGGIDSAVTLAIAERALGKENLHVLLMPSKYSSDHSVTDSVEMAKNLGISYEIISIKEIVDAFEGSLKPLFKDLPPDIAEENIQARIRGTLLMALSNKFGNILLNTSNKSEAAVGYGTLYGDMNGGLSVLGDVYKTSVFKLARYINKDGNIIPENIITKPPSAELRPDQKDSDSLPDYAILDQILYHYIEKLEPVERIVEKGFDRKLVERVVSLVNRNEHKRYQTPPILRISQKAFGIGRRMPLVAKYQ